MFELTEQEKDIQRTVRRFADAEIRPRALEYDQAPKGNFCWDIVRKATEIGIPACYVPEKYGGMGVKGVSALIIEEELAAADAGISGVLTVTGLAITPIILSRDTDLMDRFLRPLAESGNSGDPQLWAFGITEPNAGSDVENTQGSKKARLMTFAKRDGDSYVLNGRKCFITNGSVAHWITIFACLDRKKGVNSWTCFAVPTDSKGFSIGTIEEKLGWRAAPAAELILEDVRVPVEYRIGKEGEAFGLNQASLAVSRPGVAAMAVGIAREAFEIALRFAAERYQGGKQIIEHQAIQIMLADMAIQIEAARSLAYNVGRIIDKKGIPSLKLSSMAKTFASDVCMKVCMDAIQVMGGYGYMREYRVEKCFRDAKLTQIFEGTNQINRLDVMEGLMEEIGFSPQT